MTVALSRSPSPLVQGLRDGLPFLAALMPFGLLFGVAANEAGLGLGAAMGFSIGVIAGASQFTAVSLIHDGAPALVVVLTALAVNLRMAMYSAALAPHLGAAPLWQRALASYALFDSTYACAAAAYPRHPGWSLGDRLAYFAGTAGPAVVLWLIVTALGSVLGATIPPWLALDFAAPICFLAMVAPGLRTLPQVAAALTSVAGALLLAWVPYSLGLLVAAVAAMAVGAEVERRLARRGRA
ncbi:AzlC family ABC transporter permease [Rubellimicrobium roseum]|uniref:Branched-chain amino acid ABC transporter permease n=1 Tax=Rubellimicrobium roseum TaxID=687525 RepID=A0A5C4NI77_9RHOB|nr:AzlC family ABC transporter permease [Rubellimicrobium roseum]TNC72387.1 branched-chain amino acid ABC transporter permease [Rubellimicrobium roseum]